ncbi:unnamed protein product [Enterobius vermicularis]|uniref:Acyl_transf_3 domain-containing protein n=1 Tax=Enterobius vermicularis TaxID=51028 RepID=A0A0N4VHT3_ENTVE|nr:unnamed protein product [Enterobius vermicularis]
MLLLKHFSEWRRQTLPPVSTRTMIKHYIPLCGAVSHSLYTVHIFSPSLLRRFFPTCDTAVEHTLLSTANIGLGCYLFFRPHLNRLRIWDRVQCSVLTAVLFNFGSLLAAVFLKALLPTKSSNTIKSLLAFGLSWLLLSRGHRYLALIDSRVKRKNRVQQKKLPKPLEVLAAI